ncbi:hypothetical protein Pmani_000186 [Petrolisthes manimaculis]|uniref:Dynein regulatory complex protein 10 n=1 Tax=Petrolisthes manimaculis TaxID=1843537 RepID=A0AAE1QPM4_9EUCA|nr:hypothetical protein Pmani_000186 [Petrolisthes manimaculis]
MDKPSQNNNKDNANTEPTHSEVERRKSSVLRVITTLLEDSQNFSSILQDPRNTHPIPDQKEVTYLVGLLGGLPLLVHHRLYFNPTLQYFYASQLTRRKANTSRSGESVEVVERKLTDAQKERERELTSRELLLSSLSSHLIYLDSSGREAVQKCRQETRVELEEIRSQSDSILQHLQQDYTKSQEGMKTQEQRHEKVELKMRENRLNLERKIQELIRKYDVTMSRYETRLDYLKSDHSTLLNQLEVKKAWLSEVEEKYKKIQEEKQRKEEERLAALQAEFRREYAARTIQRAWQHYKMRKMLKKAQRKRKKKPKETFSGKRVTWWQDDALHANTYSTTPDSGPHIKTPTLQHHHAHAPPPSSHKTPATLATASLSPAMQKATKPACTPQPTTHTLLWVKDLESGDNFLVDSVAKDRECQVSTTMCMTQKSDTPLPRPAPLFWLNPGGGRGEAI